jgi:aryl-alcohol dehydrogenase-like predicted oxidoreductase
VALAWLIAQGAVPIPGAKNREQAEQNAGALGWRLTADELDILDAAALYGTRGISQRIWQHG